MAFTYRVAKLNFSLQFSSTGAKPRNLIQYWMNKETYIEENNIYDFRELFQDAKIINIFSKTENLFKSLFDDYASKYNIQNYYFHFDNNRYCSSSATNVDDSLNIIKVSCAYPLVMHNKLYESNLSQNEVIQNLYNSLILDEGFDFNDFFLECSIRFTFFHEFRHILQFENKSNLFSENISNGFSQERHLYEIDADLFAIRYVLDFVYDTFQKLNKKDKKNFKSLSVIAIGSVITTNLLYFFKDIDDLERVENKFIEDKFYIMEKSHPHNLIRNANIVESYTENLNANYPLYVKLIDLLKFPFEIAYLYIKHNLTSENDLLKIYFDSFETHLDQINHYSNKIYELSLQNEKITRIRNRYPNIV